MNILYIGEIDETDVYNYGLVNLLLTTDQEFFPPLSYRNSTRDQIFDDTKTINHSSDIEPYISAIRKQKNILALEDNQVCGFLSFIHDYRDETLGSEYAVNNYVSTICVNPQHRRLGIANLLYRYLEKSLPDSIKSKYITTRTWKDNFRHINLLTQRNYCLVHRIANHRKYNDIITDTVYFAKSLNYLRY